MSNPTDVTTDQGFVRITLSPIAPASHRRYVVRAGVITRDPSALPPPTLDGIATLLGRLDRVIRGTIPVEVTTPAGDKWMRPAQFPVTRLTMASPLEVVVAAGSSAGALIAVLTLVRDWPARRRQAMAEAITAEAEAAMENAKARLHEEIVATIIRDLQHTAASSSEMRATPELLAAITFLGDHIEGVDREE